MKKWIVKVSWVHDWTVTSHLTIEALTAGDVRNYIKHAHPDHKVVSIEPHWEMEEDNPDLDYELARILHERTGDD